MANIALSPSRTNKLRSKEQINKIRHGSPKLQEILREKCRQRMREKRNQLFNKNRFGLELNSRDLQDTLTEVVRQEFKNLNTSEWQEVTLTDVPLDPDEALQMENEIVNEQEQWILQEYERMMQNELALLVSTEEQITCPMCQKSNLAEVQDGIGCQICSLRLKTRASLKEISSSLCRVLDFHSSTCSESPGFTVIPNEGLYVLCHSCSTMELIV
ncbi:hypothetical protein KM043_016079 [Ampulex compressa]|nr:hypothetical protein KM043_016079 [Ampulex compressa]